MYKLVKKKPKGGNDLSVVHVADGLHLKTCCGRSAALHTNPLFTAL